MIGCFIFEYCHDQLFRSLISEVADALLRCSLTGACEHSRFLINSTILVVVCLIRVTKSTAFLLMKFVTSADLLSITKVVSRCARLQNMSMIIFAPNHAE